MAALANQLPIGLSIAAVLLLIALGLTFTFGQMGVVNMAHGEFIMVGAYTAYLLQGAVGGQSLLVALPVAFAVAGLLGLLLEWSLIRRFYGRPLDTLLLTWGVSLVLQQLARDVFGAPNVQVTAPAWLVGGVDVLGVRLPHNRVFITALAALCVLGVGLYLAKLPQGRRMRAVVQNRELAACSGIATGRVDRSTFLLGSGLAGVAGVALTLVGPVGPGLGTFYIVDAFLVVVAGGLGRLRGAVLAALALGFLNGYLEFWTDASLAKVLVFVAVIAFLQIRPQGMVALRGRSLG
ncbi:urea ABC transporter permease subunit UrtB [Saccharothrix coeruleofusca]|uniref:Branched-chain amino acid ABC transporter permease n=1 Tax=Saccharothrix coeruleofusca TaxID=33919 RepID=A0A918ASS0_9PSEU|nr:urea ABC transporter permease subunit UrtB [Saccharothrix coeruleofusca]GGP71143.1 branched-chain amino acid ABC transporter permease [Saccharothrix coeruleofusca]